MTIEEFLPLVGRTVVADCDPRPAELTLVEASRLRHDFGSRRPPFITIFRSAWEVLLVAGNYAISADGFGPATIYLSQIAPPPAGPPGHYYQAVFN